VASNCIDKSLIKQLPSKSHGDGAGGDLGESGGEDERGGRAGAGEPRGKGEGHGEAVGRFSSIGCTRVARPPSIDCPTPVESWRGKRMRGGRVLQCTLVRVSGGTLLNSDF